MCEYCGCQSVASIDLLTREHDAVVALIAPTRAAATVGDVAAAAVLARRIATVLGPHTTVEEDALFPALVDDFPEHVEVLRTEHVRIDAVLAEAADGVPERSWCGRLIAALEELREHILKEQDGLFPAALGALSPAQWQQLDELRERTGSALAATVGGGASAGV